MNFAVGQRWVSQAENELGLGTIIQLDNRFVHVMFPAAEESRQYAIDQAPLMRVEFSVGDTLTSLEEFKFVVTEIQQTGQTLVYAGSRIDNNESVLVKEIMLDHHVSLNTPEARLFTANFDRPNWFNLRLKAHQYKANLEQSSLLGLQGARVSLIPHQLYIADTVGKRFAPRVLLADEVGLGKTIEAGLIIHQQLISGRSQRVLLILPESLQHQWLVEMLRRFNLKFSIFDDERCEAEFGQNDGVNPFDNEQQILVSQEWLARDEKWQKSLRAANWDLVVVDEAHHVTPHAEDSTHNDLNQLFAAVTDIGTNTEGLVLLTATPDQLGHYGHFLRLQLLDPSRFHSYETFLEDEAKYKQVAEIATTLLNHDDLDKPSNLELSTLLADPLSIELIGEYNAKKDRATTSEKLISSLLDRHGTGRIMFRNSRVGVKGFPSRKVSAYGLQSTESYLEDVEFIGLLPECHHSILHERRWWEQDARVNWLCDFLKENKDKKVLIICARAETALALDEAMFEKEGLRTTVFHEGMTIVERDKAAAYFADEENSAQALVCSEIGSEGRNFQFAHQLVLFDLPANPDLLEQRIGRLDRIGQTETIQIHVPYLNNSAQQNLFNFYHNAFNAFEQTSSTARIVFEENSDLIDELINGKLDSDKFEQLVADCQKRNLELRLDIEQGRDRLLEINSGGGDAAKQISNNLEDADDSTDLMNFMNTVWDQFGVQQEEISTFSSILSPGEHMLNDHFPELMEDGMTVCFDRDTALSKEDQHFLSWEHPMVTGTLEMLTSSDLGNVSICLLPHKQLPPGTVLLEVGYLLTTTAPKKLQLHRYLPNKLIRVLLDKNANNLADKVKQGSLDSTLKNAKKQVALQLVKALKDDVSSLLEQGEVFANNAAAKIKQSAKEVLIGSRKSELERLEALQAVNPAIRDEEIIFLQTQIDSSLKEIESARVQLDSIRLIVATQGK